MVFDIDCKSESYLPLDLMLAGVSSGMILFLQKSTKPLNFIILVTIYEFFARKR